MKVVDAATVRAMDAAAIKAGTPGRTLMLRAGIGVADEIRQLLNSRYAGLCDCVLVLAGRGNNGGDGLVIAADLARDLPVCVFSSNPRTDFSGDARLYSESLPTTVPWRWGSEIPAELLQPRTLIIDAMLGTGATGPLRAPFDTFVAQVNAANLPIVAVDVPSGLDATTGSATGGAVVADCTITIGAPKTGLYQNDGGQHTGIVRFVDIGLTPPADATSPYETLVLSELRAQFTPQPPDRHKGTMGRVVIVGGCRQYRGAPILAARGALRTGAGLVTAVVPAGARTSSDPAAIMTYAVGLDNQLSHRPASEQPLDNILDAADVLILGPGLGRTPPALAFLEPLFYRPQPKVIDADGLLALEPGKTPLGPTVITPHPGEFRQLAERFDLELPDDRFAAAAAMAEHLNLIVVLKGQRTIVAHPDQRLIVCGRGCAALATGGTGDVLAGVIGTLLTRFPKDPFTAAAIAVWLHAAASEAIPLGSSGFIADDLPAILAHQLRSLNPLL